MRLENDYVLWARMEQRIEGFGLFPSTGEPIRDPKSILNTSLLHCHHANLFRKKKENVKVL
jgi:hypothetical protein